MLYTLAEGRTVDDVLKAISKDRVLYALEKPGDDHQYHLVRAESWDPEKHTLGDYRPVEPLKALVFPPREFLGTLKGRDGGREIEERIVIGVKNCDLSALRIHDHVFLNSEPVDPTYKALREKTLLVSCDCAGFLDVCFCPVVDEQPHPRDGFDVNITKMPDGYLLETGSERGEKLLEAAKDLLKEAPAAVLEERDRLRKEMYDRVVAQADGVGLKPQMDLQKAIANSFESELWDDFAKDCVECGACNFCCCTCHCFLLVDGTTTGDKAARTKVWDSCLYRNFARVAGGANPRAHRAERLLNRFDKKFNFFPRVLNTYACDGCGRCVEACTGDIDIRDVLKRAVDES